MQLVDEIELVATHHLVYVGRVRIHLFLLQQ